MQKLSRRNLLHTGCALAIPPGLLAWVAGCRESTPIAPDDPLAAAKQELTLESQETLSPAAGTAMKIHYLEIVTPEVDALCAQYATVHGLTFSEPDANLGGARTTKLADGGLLGIRGPLRDTETPVVRPYALVDDIQAAVAAAAESGAEIALPPMVIPEHGTCAIVIQGGIESGLWQV